MSGLPRFRSIDFYLLFYYKIRSHATEDQAMPRPRRLTDADVLDRATGVFWRNGYVGASLRDLTAATGLSAAALYHRYGDKDGLFRAVLDRYADQGLTERIARLSALADPLEAVSVFFHEMRALSLNDQDRLGCLLVNTVLDGAPLPEDTRALAKTRLSGNESFFRACLEKARSTGHFAGDPATTAELLLATLLAMRVLARLDPDPGRLDRLVTDAIDRIQPQRSPA